MSGKKMHTYSFSLVAQCIILPFTGCAQTIEPNSNRPTNQVRITVDANDIRGGISTMLTGVNTSYYFESDQLWADGKIAGYLRDIKAGILRYPGGCETSKFHWETPYNHWDVDFWDPNVEPNTPTTAYMDTDDYIRQCRIIGAEPLLGVNIQSGIRFNKISDSIAEAARWVKYCKDKNYNVRYWYLDNELHFGSNCGPMTTAEYADYIKQFVSAMRAVDPNIKIIVNHENKLSEPNYWAQLEYLIAEAGAYFDILDVHWYWDNGRTDWDNWLVENPMISRLWCEDCNGPDRRYKGLPYAEEIRQFNKKVNAIGRDIKLASLEWNVGRCLPRCLASPFQCSLMQAEMMGQFIEGGLHMACLWALHWPGVQGNRYFLDNETYKPGPTLQVFKMYSNVLGQQLITTQTSRIYIRPVSAMSQDDNTLWVYLLNKSADGQAVRAGVDIRGFTPTGAEAIALTSPVLSSDTGELKKLQITISPETGKWETVLPPYSLTMLTFHK